MHKYEQNLRTVLRDTYVTAIVEQARLHGIQ